MTPNVAEALMWAGVTPPKPGSNRTICPKCSHNRKEHNRNKPCMTVFDRGDYVEFWCRNCEWVHTERVG